jgi:hypothetical protein
MDKPLGGAPAVRGSSATSPDTCWLCLGMGGIAIHYLWSERRGKPLWTAHEYLTVDTHPIRPGPVCADA